MHRPFFAICMGLLLLSPLQTATAGGRKSPTAVVTFHIETQPEDNRIFRLNINGKVRCFRSSPEISGNDIQAFGPFPADDQTTYGVVFRLKSGGKMKLSAVTGANMGRFLLATVNGRPVDFVTIDREVDDGCLVVWKGVTLAEIKAFDKLFPRIGEKPKKKKWWSL